MEQHFSDGEDQLVMTPRRADIARAWNIGRRQHAEHPGRGFHGGEIERNDAAVRDLGQPGAGMRQPRQRLDVVAIARRTRHMQAG